MASSKDLWNMFVAIFITGWRFMNFRLPATFQPPETIEKEATNANVPSWLCANVCKMAG
jgi:hypothetical protein